jgi:hypothetical protein
MGHLTKWLFFNLMFGAIPYALVVALNQLQSPGTPLLHPSSEVLFIAVVATSSALGELWDGEDDVLRRRLPGRARWQLFMLIGVLSSSLLYGAYVYHTLMSPGRAYGVDCSAVAQIGAQPRFSLREVVEAVAQWSPTCARWTQIQAGCFEWSLWLTGFWVIIAIAAMHHPRPQRR